MATPEQHIAHAEALLEWAKDKWCSSNQAQSHATRALAHIELAAYKKANP